jgi:Ca2+-binding EF-hand superfamily protein
MDYLKEHKVTCTEPEARELIAEYDASDDGLLNMSEFE